MENILKNIKAFVFDVDGVLTDGGLLADLHGEFYRTFDAKDEYCRFLLEKSKQYTIEENVYSHLQMLDIREEEEQKV